MLRKVFSVILVLLLCAGLAIPVLADADELLDCEKDYVIDGAGLLTSTEKAELIQTLSSLSAQYNVELAVVTLDSLDGYHIDDYSDRFYDRLNYGFGSYRNGVMLMIEMEDRNVTVMSNGQSGIALSQSATEDIRQAVTPALSEGEYAQAFHIFATECAYHLDGNINGFPFDFGKWILIALIVGLLIGLIVALILKGQLKSVRKQHRAHAYIRDNSMHLHTANDFYLYRTVSRIRKPTNSSGGSSGGSIRSRSSGKF